LQEFLDKDGKVDGFHLKGFTYFYDQYGGFFDEFGNYYDKNLNTCKAPEDSNGVDARTETNSSLGEDNGEEDFEFNDPLLK